MWLGTGFGCYGSDCDAIELNTISKTGKVLFKDNLIYYPVGSCVAISNNHGKNVNNHASFSGNTFINYFNAMFFTEVDGINPEDSTFVLFIGNEKKQKEREKYYLK